MTLGEAQLIYDGQLPDEDCECGLLCCEYCYEIITNGDGSYQLNKDYASLPLEE
jgi:hypothetical protein